MYDYSQEQKIRDIGHVRVWHGFLEIWIGRYIGLVDLRLGYVGLGRRKLAVAVCLSVGYRSEKNKAGR